MQSATIVCVMQLLVKISCTRPKLISWEESGDICLIHLFSLFFLQKSIPAILSEIHRNRLSSRRYLHRMNPPPCHISDCAISHSHRRTHAHIAARHKRFEHRTWFGRLVKVDHRYHNAHVTVPLLSKLPPKATFYVSKYITYYSVE